MKAQLERETVLIKAREIMQRPVLATTVRASVRDIASQLVGNGFSGMPVADRDGTVVGVITEADIIKALVEEKPLESLTAYGHHVSEPNYGRCRYAPRRGHEGSAGTSHSESSRDRSG